MPFLREGRYRALGEAADLVADHVERRIVEPDPPEPGLAAFGDERAEP